MLAIALLFVTASLVVPSVAAAETSPCFRPKDIGGFVNVGQAAEGDSVRPDPSPAAQFGL